MKKIIEYIAQMIGGNALDARKWLKETSSSFYPFQKMSELEPEQLQNELGFGQHIIS